MWTLDQEGLDETVLNQDTGRTEYQTKWYFDRTDIQNKYTLVIYWTEWLLDQIVIRRNGGGQNDVRP